MFKMLYERMRKKKRFERKSEEKRESERGRDIILRSTRAVLP